MTVNIEDIAVKIERSPKDNKHRALVNGEVIAYLSPYRRSGYGGRITSWRIINAATRKVDIAPVWAENADQQADQLTKAARRLWFNRQPDVIKRKARETREQNLKTARQTVAYFEKSLAEAKAYLNELEKESV